MCKRPFLSGAKIGFLLVFITLLTACVSIQDNDIPVNNISIAESIPRNGQHKVAAKETLYSIAWRYGLDYRYLASLNRIKPPYTIWKGEIIYLRPIKQKKTLNITHVRPKTISHTSNLIYTKEKTHTPSVINTHRTEKKTIYATKPKVEKIILVKETKEPKSRVSEWLWPASGAIESKFSALNKGINISGKIGDPIYATAAGKVVYCGNGLRRYGNLIIIKHNSTFLTAYAHNNKLFVHQGDWVKAGQKIAEMGHTDTKAVQLHFEIRRNGQPVNPLFYLAKK